MQEIETIRWKNIEKLNQMTHNISQKIVHNEEWDKIEKISIGYYHVCYCCCRCRAKDFFFIIFIAVYIAIWLLLVLNFCPFGPKLPPESMANGVKVATSHFSLNLFEWIFVYQT